MILTFCYFIFILPIAIIEWLPEAVSNRAFISVSIYLCYWFVYVVNFFIYVIFWRRIRTVIILMMQDIVEALGFQTQTKRDAAKDFWWDSLQRLDQDHRGKVETTEANLGFFGLTLEQSDGSYYG